MSLFKVSVFDILVYAFFIGTLFIFSILNAHLEYNVFFIVVCFFLFFFNPKYLFFLYVIILTTNGIIDKEYFVFSLFGIKQIVSIFMLAYLFTIPKEKVSNVISQISEPVKFLFIIYITYGIYTAFKNAYFGLQEYSFSYAFLRSVNILILELPLFLLIDKIHIKKISQHVNIGVVFGIINMIIFTLLSPWHLDLGIKSIGTEYTEFDNNSYARYAGIIADGDSNTIGVFMVMSIGFIINQYKYYNRFIVYGIISLGIICIALTGSRTAFISLIAVFFLFFFRDRNTKLKIQFFAVLITLIVISLPLWQMTFDRLALSDNQLEINSESNRIGKWILYMNFIIQNPQTFITGTVTELKIGWGDIFYSAHNVYIQILYNAGLFFVGIIIWSYTRIIKSWNKLNIPQNIWYVFLPYLLITMVVSDMGIIYYTVLFLVLIPLQYFISTEKIPQ